MAVTHVLDTSAALAGIFSEPGAERVRAILTDPGLSVSVSVLTLYEVYTTSLHRTGSEESARETVNDLREAVGEIPPVTESVLEVAFTLRRRSAARIAPSPTC